MRGVSSTTELGKALCLLGAVFGAAGLVGWIAGVEALVTLVPGQPPIMPNTAGALLLLGFAGALHHPQRARRSAQLFCALASLVVLAIGILTTLEYVLDLPFSIDQVIVRSHAGPFPGRPSPPTAFTIALLATAILASEWRRTKLSRASEWLISSAGLIAVTFVVAQTLGAGPLYRLADTPVVGVAVPTALSLLLISLGLLLERPDSKVTRIAISSKPGDIMLRQLALAFILIAVFTGVVASLLHEAVSAENAPFVRANLTVFGTVLTLLLFGITARRLNRMHEALERSQARARDVIALASDGIFIADLEGRYREVNDAGCRMLGLSQEEILTKTILDLIPPEDVARLTNRREHLLEGGMDLAEWRLLKKDGSYLPVEVSAKILPDSRWQGIVRDISERKFAEEALRQAQERLELALKGADLATWDWNVKTGEVIFNSRWAEMRGFRCDEISPNVESWSRSIHPDDWPMVSSRLKACFEQPDKEFEAEYRVVKSTGEWIWLLDRGRIFARDEQGRPTRMAGTELDISPRKRAEREQRVLAHMSAVVTGKLELTGTLAGIAQVVAADLADYCTVDLIEDGKVQRIDAVSRDPGHDRVCEVLLRRSLDRSAVESQNGAVVQEVTPDVISSWAPGAEDRTVIDSARFKSVIVVPLRAHGKLLGALSLFSSSTYEPEDLRLVDVIAERAALLIQSSLLYLSATRAAQARDNVLAVVAHDIRNPLTAVAALAAVLKKGSEYEIGQEIADAASDMKRLIDDLVEVTRIETGRLALNPGRLPVAQIISDALQRQRALASAEGIELRLDPLPALPDIWADRDRLLQVFANLIGNAIKFTNEGGCVTVRAAEHENAVLFSVSDTGCGIASRDVPHVFDRFWQASGQSHRGLGFGLAIVKGIVENQGGRVWAESVVGKGSTFSFTVPMAQPEPTAVRPEPVEAD